MQDTLNKIEIAFQMFMADARLRANKDNKSAGVRSRVAIAPINNLLKEWRKKSM